MLLCRYAYLPVTLTTPIKTLAQFITEYFIKYELIREVTENLVKNAAHDDCPDINFSYFYLLDKVSVLSLSNRGSEYIQAESLTFFPLCSLDNVSGNEKIYSDNITRILDRLLDGYDNRLRPGSGGNSNFKS